MLIINIQWTQNFAEYKVFVFSEYKVFLYLRGNNF